MKWALLGNGRIIFWLLTLPAMLYILVWRIAPALYTVWLSLTQFNLVYDDHPRWVFLNNYGRILHDAGFVGALTLSVEFTVVVTTAEVIAGLAAAAFLDSDPPGRNLLLGTFLIPMIMVPVVVGTVWAALFDGTVGPIPYFLRVLHGPQVNWLATPLTAFFGLVIADVWQWTPFIALLLFSALQTIPKEQVEAARVDGASWTQYFARIILPQILGMILVAAGLRLMDAFLELDKVFVMTGGGPGTATQFISMYVYKQAFQFYDLGYASTAITMLLIVLGAAYAVYLRSYSRSRVTAGA